MREALVACWPLLLGIGLMMLGNGLQGSLLGVRASLEGFPTAVTGLVMSGYYVGYLAGSFLAPKVLQSVGHVRVFAALASLASTAALIHALWPDPIIWGVFRIITGFCFAGLYIVSESWLNDIATNETRGQILSVYMVVTFAGMAGGQLLLMTSDPGGFTLFILISVLVSLALVPSALSASPMPAFDAPEKLGIKALFRISPLGVVGIIIVGALQGAFFAMGAVYGGEMGLTLQQISLFIFLAVMGGILMQFPIGKLSDVFDRRQVLLMTAVGAVVASLLVFYTTTTGNVFYLLLATTLYGGFTMPLYSLCIAHTNDHLEPSQLVAASSGMILMNGFGAIVGPIVVSFLMAIYGHSAFFIYMAAASGLIAAFAVLRMTMRTATPMEEQLDFVPMPVRSGLVAVSMNPEAEWEEHEPDPSARTLTKASMSILEDFGVDDDDEDHFMDDGPSLWNRNG